MVTIKGGFSSKKLAGDPALQKQLFDMAMGGKTMGYERPAPHPEEKKKVPVVEEPKEEPVVEEPKEESTKKTKK